MWKKWVPIVLTPIAVSEAKIITAPGVPGMAISIKDRLLKGHHKPVLVGIPQLVERLPALIKGKLWIQTTPTGLQVSLAPPKAQPIVLWKEEEIDPQRPKT